MGPEALLAAGATVFFFGLQTIVGFFITVESVPLVLVGITAGWVGIALLTADAVERFYETAPTSASTSVGWRARALGRNCLACLLCGSSAAATAPVAPALFSDVRTDADADAEAAPRGGGGTHHRTCREENEEQREDQEDDDDKPPPQSPALAGTSVPSSIDGAGAAPPSSIDGAGAAPSSSIDGAGAVPPSSWPCGSAAKDLAAVREAARKVRHRALGMLAGVLNSTALLGYVLGARAGVPASVLGP